MIWSICFLGHRFGFFQEKKTCSRKEWATSIIYRNQRAWFKIIIIIHTFCKSFTASQTAGDSRSGVFLVFCWCWQRTFCRPDGGTWARTSAPQMEAAAVASSGSSGGTRSSSAMNHEGVGPCATMGAMAKLKGGMRESCTCPSVSGSTPECKKWWETCG